MSIWVLKILYLEKENLIILGQILIFELLEKENYIFWQILIFYGCVTIVLLKVSLWAPKNRGH